MATVEERFWAKVDKRGPDECWPWIAYKDDYGYGQMHCGGKAVRAHRVSWELSNGKIPDGACVCHTCDNPQCCNPNHYFLGTRAENNKDRDGKGRGVSLKGGEGNGNAKLTKGSVRMIRKYYSGGGCTQAWLAQVYKVNERTIWKVLSRKSWGHI